ncbi:sensor histidine kinase [Acidisoma sp. 7E03]
MNDAPENQPEEQVEALLATPGLADALESEQFRHFLDQIPIAIAVAEMRGPERIIYANPTFERLTGLGLDAMQNRPWDHLADLGSPAEGGPGLGIAIVEGSDCIGTFRFTHEGGETVVVDAYANVIEDEAGTPAYRLAALVNVTAHHGADEESLTEQLRRKDTLLREVQHRVKNNLQMITALIRIEARDAGFRSDPESFDRLAGRIEAIQLLYDLLSEQDSEEEIDLGIYLGKVATAVLRSQGAPGIRLDMTVDIYPVSVNVAMPTGLVVNELLTNALKHAFRDREGGTITLHSLTDAEGCCITIADDGPGLPEGMTWPQRGKLSYAIMASLQQNAKAQVEVQSRPGEGMRVVIRFRRAHATPEAAG